MVTQHARRALLIGVAMLCPIAALAQADPEKMSAVLDCADIEREILRLECYDEAVAAIRRGARADSADRREAADEDAGGTGSRGRDARASGQPEITSTQPETASAQPETDDGEPRPSAPRIAAERDLDAAADPDDREANDARGDRPVTIVEVRTPIPGRAVFVTSDGDEFVQTSGRLRLFLPDVPFQAELRSGAVGGLFLTPEGTRRSIRISERD